MSPWPWLERLCFVDIIHVVWDKYNTKNLARFMPCFVLHCSVFLSIDLPIPYMLHRGRTLTTAPVPGIILGMGSANERRRYIVTSSLIGRAHDKNDPCVQVKQPV